PGLRRPAAIEGGSCPVTASDSFIFYHPLRRTRAAVRGTATRSSISAVGRKRFTPFSDSPYNGVE
ncbi:hypothetical protein, partial [Paenibacillus agaridevorans]|uniref:hypothetical protein n=1 Tax=Paenibacillus agaridevorans TaxID=171404 RepID=UPI001C626B38